MLRVDHIVFPVWDAKKSFTFYKDVLDFQLLDTYTGDDWGGYPWMMLFFSVGDGREIVLVSLKGKRKPKADGVARDVRHIALAENSLAALEKWRKKLAAAKVAFWEETHGKQQSLYFEDPNGVVLEITAPPTRARGTSRKQALALAERWMAA